MAPIFSCQAERTTEGVEKPVVPALASPLPVFFGG